MVKIKLNNINSTILYLIGIPYLKETELKTFALFIFSKFARRWALDLVPALFFLLHYQHVSICYLHPLKIKLIPTTHFLRFHYL